ncbi:hypothetical protein Dsin_021270 [Dipteronia sinensis]|uniref:Uncharacterized protein n=1 Tax=Dipteronia sinensis TaxID=43782 RepID=A0AAD9ZZU5_9ROSI|nr:hypothetical protein Dsin_021270 [Dipteronia sinensis]
MRCSSAKITFPKLKDLELMYLPELKSIYKGFMLCKSLRCITVLYCPMLKRLSLTLHEENDQTSAPAALKQIIGQEKWWESLEWDEPDAKATLQTLFYNVKNKCNLVKSIMIIDYRSLLHYVSQA